MKKIFYVLMMLFMTSPMVVLAENGVENPEGTWMADAIGFLFLVGFVVIGLLVFTVIELVLVWSVSKSFAKGVPIAGIDLMFTVIFLTRAISSQEGLYASIVFLVGLMIGKIYMLYKVNKGVFVTSIVGSAIVLGITIPILVFAVELGV